MVCIDPIPLPLKKKVFSVVVVLFLSLVFFVSQVFLAFVWAIKSTISAQVGHFHSQ